jgi:hypothetical protein
MVSLSNPAFRDAPLQSAGIIAGKPFWMADNYVVNRCGHNPTMPIRIR